VTFTVAILAVVLSYIWLVEPVATGPVRAVPVILVLGLTVWRAARTGEWGLRWDAFLPALRLAAVWTTAAVAVLVAAGAALGTLHAREQPLADVAFLALWGGGQQFALQTVLLREAQAVAPPRAAIVLAAFVFGAVHLPNPFLAPATFAGALGWCWIYARHPNIVPLALSHAVATLAILHAFDAGVTGRLRIGLAYLNLVWGE
jgi:membrane protease YdiL (CAAX protease family)